MVMIPGPDVEPPSLTDRSSALTDEKDGIAKRINNNAQRKAANLLNTVFIMTLPKLYIPRWGSIS